MTAFVERVNLTLREHVPPLSRRTWSLARDEHTLQLYIEWGRRAPKKLHLEAGCS